MYNHTILLSGINAFSISLLLPSSVLYMHFYVEIIKIKKAINWEGVKCERKLQWNPQEYCLGIHSPRKIDIASNWYKAGFKLCKQRPIQRSTVKWQEKWKEMQEKTSGSESESEMKELPAIRAKKETYCQMDGAV